MTLQALNWAGQKYACEYKLITKVCFPHRLVISQHGLWRLLLGQLCVEHLAVIKTVGCLPRLYEDCSTGVEHVCLTGTVTSTCLSSKYT